MNNTASSCAQVLKAYRIAHNISQLNLELDLNLAPGVISRIENGKINPTKETLQKFVRRFKMPVRDIAIVYGFEDILE